MSERIKFDNLEPHQAAAEYAVLWITVSQEFPYMNEEELTKVISLIVDVCPHCFEDTRGCHCWNDE